MSKHIVITGANRGIGLALTENYLNQGYAVTALCRQSSDGLASSGAAIYDGIEVTDYNALLNVAELINQPIDILINNAGIFENETLANMDFKQISRQFEINALAPLKVFDAFSKRLQSGSKLAFITSRMGSIADNSSGHYYGYRMSKAALNMACTSLAIDLKERDISVAILHPGMVQTRMIDFAGDVSPKYSAANLIKRIEELDTKNSGTFWHANGDILPW